MRGGPEASRHLVALWTFHWLTRIVESDGAVEPRHDGGHWLPRIVEGDGPVEPVQHGRGLKFALFRGAAQCHAGCQRT